MSYEAGDFVWLLLGDGLSDAHRYRRVVARVIRTYGVPNNTRLYDLELCEPLPAWPNRRTRSISGLWLAPLPVVDQLAALVRA